MARLRVQTVNQSEDKRVGLSDKRDTVAESRVRHS